MFYIAVMLFLYSQSYCYNVASEYFFPYIGGFLCLPVIIPAPVAVLARRSILLDF